MNNLDYKQIFYYVPPVLILLLMLGYYFAIKDIPRAKVITLDNTVTKTETQAVTEAFNKNNFSEANKIADEMLTRDQKDFNALMLKAHNLAQEASLTFKEKELGNQAMKYVDRALIINSKSTSALTLKGYIYEIQQDYVNAHKHYDKTLTLDPNNSDALAQKAHAYDLEGKTGLAKSLYEKALQFDASNTKILAGYGRTLILTGERNKANEIYNKIIATTDNLRVKSESYYTLGTIAESSIYNSEVENYYQTAIDTDPTLPISYVGLGRELFKKSFVETNLIKKNELIHSSFENLKKALELNPNESYATLQVAVQILAIGNDNALAKKMLTTLEKNINNDITLSRTDKSVLQKTITSILNTHK